jgi:replication-associated recombination protein RarA
MLDTNTYDPKSPKITEDIVGNTEVWSTLKKKIHTNTCSNIILVGPPGCGKSLFLRLALAEFPTMFIDCTANFGLRDLRDSIRHFGRGGLDNINGKLRWIIFEHADVLTADTQAYLRRMLETTHNTTRICFECNEAGAITEPIISRCTLVNVYGINNTEMRYEILRRTQEKLDDTLLQTILDTTQGNLRTAILHSLACVHGRDIRIKDDGIIIDNLLNKRKIMELLPWALEVEKTCRNNGIDIRLLLIVGWPDNHIVTQTLALWSRLGGISCRALFFSCIAALNESKEPLLIT